MSEYWTPSGPAVTADSSVNSYVAASNQIEGLARIINAGTTTGIVFVCSASASASDLVNGVILATLAEIYVAFGSDEKYVQATGADDIQIQPGYALK